MPFGVSDIYRDYGAVSGIDKHFRVVVNYIEITVLEIFNAFSHRVYPAEETKQVVINI